jgi:hypothetical protein
MIALVQHGITGASVAVHRTFLARDGNGKADVEPARMALGPIGGGAVRLAEATSTLVLAEGIEDALSVMQATGLPAWAALGTAGLRVIALPEQIRDVIVAADNDEPGIKAANECARRLAAEGRSVRIAMPRGKDFNADLRLEKMS